MNSTPEGQNPTSAAADPGVVAGEAVDDTAAAQPAETPAITSHRVQMEALRDVSHRINRMY